MQQTTRTPVLDRLFEVEPKLFLDRSIARRLERNDVLHLTGDPPARVHALLKGVIKLSARDAEGNEVIVGLAASGDLVGDTAALQELPQPVDAIAATRCYVLGFDAGHFVEALSCNPEAALAVARAHADRLRRSYTASLERTSGEVPARLAGRLLDLADILGCHRSGPLDLELPLSQQDLGRLAGMCRESACKAMRSFKRKGVLDYRGKRLRILRPDLLHRIRCSGEL